MTAGQRQVALGVLCIAIVVAVGVLLIVREVGWEGLASVSLWSLGGLAAAGLLAAGASLIERARRDGRS